jgi:hypothetical protein
MDATSSGKAANIPFGVIQRRVMLKRFLATLRSQTGWRTRSVEASRYLRFDGSFGKRACFCVLANAAAAPASAQLEPRTGDRADLHPIGPLTLKFKLMKMQAYIHKLMFFNDPGLDPTTVIEFIVVGTHSDERESKRIE